MKQFLFEPEIEENEENFMLSMEMENAINEIEELFTSAEMIKPSEGFTSRFFEKLEIEKKRIYRRQIAGLLGFNLLFILVIAGFLFTNLNFQLSNMMAVLQVFFEQFFVLFDSIVKIRILADTFSDLVPLTIVIPILMFMSFSIWLIMLMLRQFLNHSVMDKKVNS
jgi:hypothetical protein